MAVFPVLPNSFPPHSHATGLLSSRQMTASPFSSAPVATTSCSGEPLAASFRTVGLFCAGPDCPSSEPAGELFCLRSAFSRGRPARNRVVFINSGGVRRREGKAPENQASLNWPYALRSLWLFLSMGRMTFSRRLPLMKTTQFLAGPPDICAHPGSGGARDKSPDLAFPCSLATIIGNRPAKMRACAQIMSTAQARSNLLSRLISIAIFVRRLTPTMSKPSQIW